MIKLSEIYLNGLDRKNWVDLYVEFHPGSAGDAQVLTVRLNSSGAHAVISFFGEDEEPSLSIEANVSLADDPGLQQIEAMGDVAIACKEILRNPHGFFANPVQFLSTDGIALRNVSDFIDHPAMYSKPAPMRCVG